MASGVEELQHRSWESLKERYRKRILPVLSRFSHLTKHDLQELRGGVLLKRIN